MKDPKSEIESLINAIIHGRLTPKEGWRAIKQLKDPYVERYSEQAWHQYIGNTFEEMVYKLISGRISQLKQGNLIPESVNVLSQSQVKMNDVVYRKIAIRYNNYLILPDIDICFVDQDFANPWNTSIIGIASCKTSLRERIAQSCYWKLKFLSSDITKHIKVYLITTDNDNDFSISEKRKTHYNGKSRNRIISEYELDGIYILRDDFREEWESEKVKRYDALFDDLAKIFKKELSR